MRLEITLLGLILGLSLAQPALAENVYKWVDKDGKVHFGDRPQSDTAEEVKPKKGKNADNEEVSTLSNKVKVSKSQIIGRWTDNSDIDVDEYFGGDGSYMGSTSINGVKVEMHGNWTLNGNQLLIKLHSTTPSDYGKRKTSTEVKVYDRRIAAISHDLIEYVSFDKDYLGTMTRTGS
ncbi:DUF4124 domain-containing protein [Shewanella sp. 3B26]|uniref:DUF4124 domain-containing protein n=1 Tax=Shewanella zhuhaiensis TaxID=2919576 RepID=A0AAJ1BE42_9GAMM|nr:DUF4124 domain-containing protein [Shewanella zhuhaiensis]MCH4293080.1 DUF4124 domain-containing protein [Shewanella zhuhaiensis]